MSGVNLAAGDTKMSGRNQRNHTGEALAVEVSALAQLVSSFTVGTLFPYTTLFRSRKSVV